MKTKQMLIVTMLMAMALLTSCNQYDLQYSCDPEIDAWTKDHVVEIQAMNRADFLTLDYAHQRGAYAAMKPEQKVQIWVGKIEEVLTLDWTEQESQHLQSVLKLIKDNAVIFSKKRTQEEFDKFEIALYRWKEYAQEELGWDKNLLYALIATPQMMNVDKTLSDLGTPLVLKRGIQCYCSSERPIACTIGYYCHAKVGTCDIMEKRCGEMWQYDCDGLCLSKDKDDH